MPRDGRAPVMPDDDGGVDTQRINNADHVADKMHQRVLVDILRTVV